MKTIRFLIFCIFTVAVTVCRAQDTDPGWYAATNSPNAAMPISSFSAGSGYQSEFEPAGQPQPSAPVAEVITPQIQALADGLGDNPTNIFNYVHDHINFVLYFGSKKGANLTLLEKSGNDFDQSALLVALLSAAGYSNDVTYQFGWEELPYNDPSGNDYDLTHWWQLTLPNTNWTNTYNYVYQLTFTRGYPLEYYADDGADNNFYIQRCWVQLQYNGTTFQLDPAFKRSVPIAAVSGFSITNAMGGSGMSISNALWTAAAGTDTANYCSNLNEVAIRSQLTAYSTNLLKNIQSNAPNASVQQVLSGWQILPANDPLDFSNATMFASGYPLATLNWTYEPTNLMSTLKISFAGTNYQWFMPQLHGDRISLTFSNNGVAQLWQEDAVLAQGSITSITTTVYTYLETSFFFGDSNDQAYASGNCSYDEWNPGTPENPGANYEYSNIVVSPVEVSQPLPTSTSFTIDGVLFNATATTTTNLDGYYPTTLSHSGLLSFTPNAHGFTGCAGNVGNTLQSVSTTSYPTNNVTIAVTHPVGGWNITNNTFIPNPANGDNQTVANTYQSTNANYVILYAFEPDWGWLQQRENKLNAYLQEGLTNGSRQVTCETLNVMGLNWLLQTEQAGSMLAPQLNILQQNYHRIGRMAEELGYGYYVDVYMQETGAMPNNGWNTNQIQEFNSYFDLWSFFSSAMEHGIIEELQNSNLVAASTVKMLEIANTNKQAVYLASSSNWSTVDTALTAGGYSSSTTAAIQNYVNNGYYVLVPKVGTNAVSTLANGWTGYGYEARQALNGSATVSIMKIGGGYLGVGAGGFYGAIVNNPIAVPNSVYTSTSAQNQPTANGQSPVFSFNPSTGDPVDTADGTYQVQSTDLSVGQATEPKGITLTRYYNGTRRFSSAGGMTGGWIHNYCVTANNVPAPQAILGGTTPQQAAAMFTATAAAVALYNGGVPDAKNWLTTALTAKWAIDQLTRSGVSVNLGKDTVQFVQQPNGVFTPPANTTATLSGTPSAYVLQMLHGNKFTFNSSGYLSSIVDQYGNTLNLTYNSSNWVSTVKDWSNRHTFTFNYSGSPLRLTSVSDGTRTVNYGYATTYNSQGDLTKFTDAQGNTNGYFYDSNHDITASVDGQGRVVVTNIYNTQGELTTQYVQNNTNKMWLIQWSGYNTTEFDPAGDEQIYSYDNQGRLVSTEDALGNVTQTFYDGQNHAIETVSPLSETNFYFYDGNNNLISSIDPLGFTNRLVYDSNDNLVQSIDPRGNTSSFGYNSEFSVTGQTNGAGNWTNYVYNSNGTLASSANAGGTTAFGYDSLGQLSSVAYLGISTNTYANSYAGDVTNKIDGRGFATAYQYNALRQLTNTIAPTNLVTRIAYDPEGNKASVVDARGNITTSAWSATRKLLSSTLPNMPQGTPIVTNIYDSRDWAIKSLDPLQNATTNAYDLNGHVISQTDPVLRTTQFRYDDDGRKTATINGATETNSQSWDAKSELIALIDGAGHISTRAYDAAGNQIVLTNRNSNPWHFYFDGANRLTNTVSPLGRSTTLALNAQGLPVQVTDPMLQITTNGFDAKGRLTNRADSFGTTLYRYDADDNLTSISENGLTNNWTFDAYDRVSSYQDVYGNLIQYRYDSNGNLTNLVYPGGRNVYYAYDSNNNMTNVTDWSGRQTTLTYDLDGHLTGVYRPNGTTRTISYDSAGEVTNILEQMANGLPIALIRYKWDQAARMSLDFVAPLPHTNTPPLRQMTYDADNELATFQGPTMGSPQSVTEDADGNLTYGPLTNDTFATYQYDPRNRLTNTVGVANFYDAANNRIGQTYGTNSIEYVLSSRGKPPIVLERLKDGTTTYYVYSQGGLLYQVNETPTSTNTLTYHYDYRGSTIALTSDSGLVTDRMEYSVYGTLNYHAGTSDTPFLFAGCYGVQSDPNGLLYMRARYYNPYLCRFLNPDPTGFQAGMNFYVYANGNPASLIDPFGLDATPLVTQTGTITANGDDITYQPTQTGGSSSGQTGWAGYDATAATLGYAGLGQSAASLTSLEGATIGNNGVLYLSGWGGGSRAMITTYKLAPWIDGVGLGFSGVSVVVDGVGAYNGNISWGHFWQNTGATAAGVGMGGPPGAIFTGSYFLIDNTYPGGWNGYMTNLGQTLISNQQISPYSDSYPIFSGP
jgi:RHS repeat-associated protein